MYDFLPCLVNKTGDLGAPWKASLKFTVTLLLGDYCMSVASLWEGMGRPEGREAKK